MTPPIEFRVRYDGPTTGLSEYRLSFESFRDPLKKLFQALRQTASTVVKGKHYSKAVKLGKLFDLQLIEVGDVCVNLRFVLIAKKIDELTEVQHAELSKETVSRFIDDLKEESRSGDPHENGIKSYLQSLPEGVSTQEYEGTIGGVSFKKAVFGTNGDAKPDHDKDPRKMAPRLRQVTGKIIAIRFAKEGRVTIKTPTNEVFVCLAAARLLDIAAQNHKNSVVAQVLIRHDVNRLLSVRDERESPDPMSTDDRRKHLVENWSETLKRLGE